MGAISSGAISSGSGRMIFSLSILAILRSRSSFFGVHVFRDLVSNTRMWSFRICRGGALHKFQNMCAVLPGKAAGLHPSVGEAVKSVLAKKEESPDGWNVALPILRCNS